NERTARLCAVDCAERVLPIFEAAHPGDSRPREAIAVARRCADGLATVEELDAARAAAESAAWYAAESAAESAAWAAAESAAWAAESAAGSAAWYAAESAAGSAARAAAESAAWSAAGSAAAATIRSAGERRWQSDRLIELLGIER
ncbi:MAG: hypothetical protein KGH93_03660, partial [Patescibacteria group bacterium]|nr:hypothetical protein [Patescibacteria group bacterium]